MNKILILYIGILFIPLIACSENNNTKIKFIANQWVGNGFEGDNRCASIYREDGNIVKTPPTFSLSPLDAVSIAKETLNFSCTHKWGAQIYADKKHYYIARLGSLDNAIIIHGVSGEIISKGFHAR
ncbi:MAG: hypothetical protein ACRBCI_14280 [Cellvibrionaceae bacterium]